MLDLEFIHYKIGVFINFWPFLDDAICHANNILKNLNETCYDSITVTKKIDMNYILTIFTFGSGNLPLSHMGWGPLTCTKISMFILTPAGEIGKVYYLFIAE